MKKGILFKITTFSLTLLLSASAMLFVRGSINAEAQEHTYYLDADNDGYGDIASTTVATTTPTGYVLDNTDCNDANALVNPGATELYDGIDNNCTGGIDEGYSVYYRDYDNDGYGGTATSTMATTTPTGYAANNTDCNDYDAAVHPGATEIYGDGIDNNCTGGIDEGYTVYYRDYDNDGYGGTATSTMATTTPTGYAANNTDCNDYDAAVHPGATEIYGDGIDNNCTGGIDEGYTVYYRDYDNDGYGGTATSTMATTTPTGYAANNTDCNDYNAAVHPGATEIYGDGIDSNCDGNDNDGYHTYYQDADGDGYGNPAVSTTTVSAPTGYVANHTDCNDSNVAIHPGASEKNDDIDNNCNGLIDENFTLYYQDADSDGYGNPLVSTTTISAPTGYVANHTDCNDSNAAIHPGASELNDDIDNNCNGNIDEGFQNIPDEPSNPSNYANHGGYVSAMAQWTNYLKKIGEITGREKGMLMKEAAQNKASAQTQVQADNSVSQENANSNGKNKIKTNGNNNGNGKAKGKNK